MIGFNVSEAGHIVNLIPPVDGNAGAPVTCQGFKMDKYDHVSIIIQLGVTAGTPTSILLVSSTAASAGTTTALAFRSYAQTTAGASHDVLVGPTSNAATGITTITGSDNVFYTIEMDSTELPDGQPYLQLQVTMPASSNLVSAIAILSAGRYQYQGSASVTA